MASPSEAPHTPQHKAESKKSVAKSDAEGTGKPARGYSWPPFEPGNEVSTTHGAFSLAKVEPRAEEIGEAIYAMHPHLDGVRDVLAVRRLAVVLARIERVDSWLAEQDDPVFENAARGKAHRVYERWERWQRLATALERQLAMSPLTRAQLGITAAHAFDLAAQWAAEDDNTIDGNAEED